jgi:hypothetical protein
VRTKEEKNQMQNVKNSLIEKKTEAISMSIYLESHRKRCNVSVMGIIQ